MWKAKRALRVAILLCLAVCRQPGTAQEPEQKTDSRTPMVVTGAAFSAVSYTRTVRMQPDGQRVTITRSHRVQVARNNEGRIFIAHVGSPQIHCDIPGLSKLPPCDYWYLLLFDPDTKTMWHWGDGATSDKTQLVQMDFEENQLAEALRKTSVFTQPPSELPESGVTIEDLGEKTMEGIVVHGVRTTTPQKEPDGSAGHHIHEVWSSARMHLVLRVIDGDPVGEETISGLLKISLAPAPSLFQPPSERILRHWKHSSIYATNDIDRVLSLWPVNN